MTTQMELHREPSTAISTPGRLSIDGVFECFTLEDVIRAEKIAGRTAIYPGRYEVILNFSERFGRLMPLLVNVPYFTGVRIHCGNTDADTKGCILVGRSRQTDRINESRAAFSLLMLQLERKMREGKLFLTILNPKEGTTPA